jgi:integrase
MPRPSGVNKDPKTGHWHVDKWFMGHRLRGRFETLKGANEWVCHRCEQIRRQQRFGERPPLTLEDAAARYLSEKLDRGMPSSESDAYHLKAVMPFCGHIDIAEINDVMLTKFRKDYESRGRSAKTIHLSVSAVQAVLNAAARRWTVPGTTLSVLERAPVLTKPRLSGKQRPGRPITWEEQGGLLAELPSHLRSMAEFGVHTGARDSVIANLRWQWILPVPWLDTYFFYVPKEYVKGGLNDQALILNSRAHAIVAAQRGLHDEFVFVWRRERVSNLDKPAVMPYRPIETMNNTAWQSARCRAGLDDLHVHDLRHTFATRLRGAGVPDGTVSDLLWHSKKDVTRKYMAAYVLALRQAVELIATPRDNSEDMSIEALRAAARRQIG